MALRETGERRSTVRRLSSLTIVFGPLLTFLVAIVLVSQARGVPDNDYWDMAASLVSYQGGIPSFSDLFVRSNEHIVAASKLIYLLNYHLSGGDNIGLSVISLIFSFVICIILSLMLAKNINSTINIAISSFLTSIFCFSILASHNFFLGMSGIAWIGANLFFILASYVFYLYLKNDSVSLLFVSILLAIISSLFYSTGLIAVCSLGIQGVVSNKNKRLGVVLLIFGALYLAAMALMQPTPGGHATRNFNIIEIVSFCLVFIGGGLSVDSDQAMLLGWGGMLTAFAIIILCLMHSERAPAGTPFWIGVMSYPVIGSGIAAIGRSNMGGDVAALASRYATMPALFWIGLFGATAGYIKNRPTIQKLWNVAFFTAAVLVIVNGLPRLQHQLTRAEGKDLATLALSHGIHDASVWAYVTPAFNQYLKLEESLKKLGHVPFDGRDFGCASLGSTLITVPSQNYIGFLDRVDATQDAQWAQITGWIAETTNPVPPLLGKGLLTTYGCLALLDDTGTVVGFALGGGHRPDVATALGTKRDDYGWNGYVNLRLLARRPTPWRIRAAIQKNADWVMLKDSIEIEY